MHWPFEHGLDIEEQMEAEVGSRATPLCLCVELVAVKTTVKMAEELMVANLDLPLHAKWRPQFVTMVGMMKCLRVMITGRQ